MFVKPKPGVLVRDPDSFLPLPAEGRDVPESSFWFRKLADGDVQRCTDPATVVRVEPIPDSKRKESASQGEE